VARSDRHVLERCTDAAINAIGAGNGRNDAGTGQHHDACGSSCRRAVDPRHAGNDYNDHDDASDTNLTAGDHLDHHADAPAGPLVA
jgi:hypothetical protein